MSETTTCHVCGELHAIERGQECPAMTAAAAAGAQPQNVPLRVYGGYLEARAALRANAAGSASKILQWLVGHVAEQRGIAADRPLAAKLKALADSGVIAPRIRDNLFERALSDQTSPEQAWALMSIVEHIFFRLYLNPIR